MMSVRERRWRRANLVLCSVAMMGLAIASACSDRCVRNSDCRGGAECVAGLCFFPGDDSGADAGGADANGMDANGMDASGMDADASSSDAGNPDSGSSNSGDDASRSDDEPDAAVMDAALMDAANLDAGLPIDSSVDVDGGGTSDGGS